MSAFEEQFPAIRWFVPQALFPSQVAPQVAQAILTSIATSTMTVVSIVFAILLMTLTLASTQFSPRILISTLDRFRAALTTTNSETGAPRRLIDLVLQHREGQHADAVFEQRLGFLEARAAANRTLGLIPEMDGSRHLGKFGADVVGIGLDFPAHMGQKFSRLPAPIVDKNFGDRFGRRTIASDHRRRHDRLVDANGTAFRTYDKPALALFLIGGTVRKPAVECMPIGAAERVFDHRSARQEFIKFACVLERVQIVAASDMRIADENLRHRPAAASFRRHCRLRGPIAIDADFLEDSRLPPQQGLGRVAKGASRLRVDDDRRHV
jgi:hypothetical protein